MTTKWWINRNVISLSLSAFFADLGYQAVTAGFPILLVLIFHAPVYMLGLAYAIAYGVGSLFGYVGGILGDRFGRKKIAMLGNVFIPFLSLTGLAINYTEAVGLFSGGWWARNFRTPARRALLSESTTKRNRSRAFGLLHVFDIGGGAIAVAYVIVLLYLGWQLQTILLITAIPILISTLFLFPVRPRLKNTLNKSTLKADLGNVINTHTVAGVLLATSLYGFSFYSLGFPILTIAQGSTDMYGIGSYLIYLAVSAISGYTIGVKLKKRNPVKSLSILGYALASFGSLVIGVSYVMHFHILFSLVAVAMMGIALGVIETLEPTILSVIASKSSTSKVLGYLTSSRSVGLFLGNVIMGILYTFDPFYSYMYAFLGAMAAALILLWFGKDFKSI